jgi:hypothetical protein
VALNAKTNLREFSITVGSALLEQGIHAVLTGGACASIYTRGRYASGDADFVLSGRIDQGKLDRTMEELGFHREADRYVHSSASFFVEFPAGPLAIGSDVDIHPIEIRWRGKAAQALSATDSCRDRLAAYFHWDDRESLEVAIEIAESNDIDWQKVKSWSEKEGAITLFKEFQESVADRKTRGARNTRAPRRRNG